MKLITLTILFFVLAAHSAFAQDADSVFGKYMVSAKGPFTYQKGLDIGQQVSFDMFILKGEGGFWVDNSDRPGATGSGFLQTSIGIEPTAGPIYANFFQGVALITHPDTVLGGNGQFVEDVGLGIRDQKTHEAIGIFYKHISSAGLERPNLGRDFIGLQISIPWSVK